MAVSIQDVEKKSPAARKHIRAGDTLLSINGNEITDVLDYRFYMQTEKAELLLQTAKGKQRVVHVRK